MAWYDIFVEQGAVPHGTRTKTIVEPGGEAGFFQTDKLSTMLRGLEAFQRKEQEKEEKRQKEMTRQVDMYKTLREAGYDPDKAYEAVMKGVSLPKPEAEDRTIPKTQREKILDKIARGVSLTEGERKVYDETIKHKDEETGDSLLNNALNQSKFHAQGDVDALIDKRNTEKGLGIVPGGAEEDVKKRGSNMVPVIAPDGTPGFIPIKNLKKALAAGYKTRKK